MGKKKNKMQKVLGVETQAEAELELVDFETWYSIRQEEIPAQHHKEIIKADFNARKMPKMATIKEFDLALAKYGVKLNG
jgi:hypothetical protein